MAYRSRRGLNATCAAQQASVFSGQLWDYIFHGCPKLVVAPPPAPSGAVLTTPPAGEEDAQATVDGLLDQQLQAQKKLNAENVTSTWLDQVSSGIVDTGEAVTSFNPLSGGVPMWAWVAGAGLAVFAVVAIGGGSPRRYGR